VCGCVRERVLGIFVNEEREKKVLIFSKKS